QRQPTGLDELLDELAVVDHLVTSAKLRVFVLDDVEAVRTARDDTPRLIGVQRLDVLLSQDLIEILVARPSSRVAAAGLFPTENGKRDVCAAEDAHQGLSEALVPVIERRHAAYPVNDLEAARILHLGQLSDADGLCP